VKHCRPVSSSTTQAGTDLVFTWLEDKFGGTLPMQPIETAVITSPQLHADDLQRLFSHDATVLHIPNFYPRETAKELGHALAHQAIQQQEKDHSKHLKNRKVNTSKGLESSDVFALGAHLPYNMAFSNGALDEYHKNVPTEIRQRQRNDSENTAKTLWPLDQLRLELDELWPHGAGLAPDRSGGLPRIMMGPTRWKHGFVHVDEMAPLSTKMGLFSANIYLQLPQATTASTNNTMPEPVLEIWPLNIRNRYDWYRNAKTLSNLSAQDAEGQVRLRKALNESNSDSKDHHKLPIRVQVEPGDLVMICAQRPYCAIGFDIPGSVRVSLQSFLQYSGGQERLTIEG
jgi:hypothetical protein